MTPDDLIAKLEARGLLEALDAVCRGCCLTRREVMGAKRTKMRTLARNLLWQDLKARGFSYPEIGAMVGRDATTILKALALVAMRKVDGDREEAADVERIENETAAKVAVFISSWGHAHPLMMADIIRRIGLGEWRS